MKLTSADLWRWEGAVGRGAYALVGFVGFGVKHNLDRVIASAGFHRPWSLFNYWIPLERAVRITSLPHNDAVFLATMLALALPFIWVGVTMTLRRLRSIGVSPWLVLLFFLPYINLLFFLILCVIPGKEESQPRAGDAGTSSNMVLARVIPASAGGSAAMAVLLTVVIGVALTALVVRIFGTYGWGLFVALPFCLGFVSVLLYGYHRPRDVWGCLGVAGLSAAMVGAGLVALALEGLFCLIMAMPLGFVLAVFGGFIGYHVQRSRWSGANVPASLAVVLLALPLLMGAEYAGPAPVPRFQVHTRIVIDAPPAAVWRRLVAFQELPTPREWPFRLGIAYPIEARLTGTGLTADRECRFSTGSFREPILVWEEGKHFRFGVSEEPLLMREWTPYAQIRVRHLEDRDFRAETADFLLTPQPGGGTLLEGATTYQNRMWPGAYWRLWSDAIVHRIHQRVFEHVKRLAEADARAPGAH